MKTIETTGTVSPDHTLTVSVPVDIEPGEHRVVVVVDEQPTRSLPETGLALPTLSVGSWPADLSLRRENMYDDSGR